MIISSSRRQELSEQQKKLLRTTTIDWQQPGPLLHDFEVLLNFIEGTPPQLTGTHLLPLRALEPLNALLSHPLQHRLSRPQQKSFPHINGLYWLLRASGLTYVDTTGKKPLLLTDAAMRTTWSTLDPTERYFVLLETWVLRAQSQIIGERDVFGLNRVVEYWDMLFHKVPDAGLAVAGDRDQEQSLSNCPFLT